ncbi:MAG TPA: sodium:proton antiporter [Acetobacteraceae bacterium]|jgi:Na+/H+ antiporter NhaD/arsenite permease-like protein|nr:sodium:proton antiporter [Acetobacteraceae bacterium]
MQPTAASWVWAIPFAGLLASMAAFPIVAPRFWHRRLGVVALFWSLSLIVAVALVSGIQPALAAIWHAMVIEYLPFVTLLLALYTAGGGVLLRGGLAGTPRGNTAMLGAGMAMGAVMGTTGASMVLIHPLLRANAHRRRKVHLVLFLIVLVANASGALTPLGNPPLYIGFLHGVPFFWPARHLVLPLLLLSSVLLTGFFLLDRYFAASEPPPPAPERFRIRGAWNLALIVLVGISVLGQPLLPSASVTLFGQALGVAQVIPIALFLAVTVVSAALTPRAVRQANDFAWEPMIEVATLFAAIFVTIGPVIAILQPGPHGALASVPWLGLGTNEPWPFGYFWLTGMLSAFLDNAPTYLVFFEMAGIRAPAMTTSQTATLMAISAGAVFFGGLTYIGNAPNMMLRTIAAHRGVRMPGFFGFTLLASAALLPVLLLVSLVFFR